MRIVAKIEGGVTADPGLGARPVLHGLAGSQSLGPSLADASWAARPAS